MTELWTVTDVAKHFGVSESRARAILSKHRIERVTGYPAAEVQAIQRPGQGARTDLKGATMFGTQVHGCSGNARPKYPTPTEGITPMSATESRAQNLVQAAQGAIGQNTSVLARHAQNWHREASGAVVAVLRELASDGPGVPLNANALNGLANEIEKDR